MTFLVGILRRHEPGPGAFACFIWGLIQCICSFFFCFRFSALSTLATTLASLNMDRGGREKRPRSIFAPPSGVAAEKIREKTKRKRNLWRDLRRRVRDEKPKIRRVLFLFVGTPFSSERRRPVRRQARHFAAKRGKKARTVSLTNAEEGRSAGQENGLNKKKGARKIKKVRRTETGTGRVDRWIILIRFCLAPYSRNKVHTVWSVTLAIDLLRNSLPVGCIACKCLQWTNTESARPLS